MFTSICSVLKCSAVTDIPKVRKRDNDDVGGPSEIKLLKQELGHGAPSSLAHASKFIRVARPGHAIDCNRPFTHDSLPIELHHEAFGRFKTRCGQPPSKNALAFLDNLALVACEWHESELYRRDEVRRVFEKYTKLRFHSALVPGTLCTTDGHLDFDVIPAAIRKCNNESGNAHNQTIVCYGKFLINALDPSHCYRNLNTHFPCILMVDQGMSVHLSFVHIWLITVHVGPRFGFYGAVWDGRVRVEALTTFDLTTHHLDENGRFTIASSLDAFKEAVDKIQAHYAKIQVEAMSRAMEHDPQLVDSRKYPYVTTFKIDGQKLAFTYRLRLHEEKLLFSATSNQPDSGNYIVKFTWRYSAEAHQSLASHGLAPILWQCKEIPGGWIAIVMDKSRYLLLYSLHLSKEEKEKVQSKVIMVLKKLHNQGFVHGDIQDINLLVDHDSLASSDVNNVRVHFIDFDWAGRVGEAKYPIGVNTESVLRPDGVDDGELITKEHDESMAMYLFP
jgi:hypothetical protein